jgi:cystathionine gamma-synthase
MMKITDIAASAKLIHDRGGILIADNTFLTPYFQKPLALGADIVVHSASKYLSGHNDVVAGLIAHSRDDLDFDLREAQKSEGASLSAFDSWLVLRGIKTLPVRMERHQANGAAIAEWLKNSDKVERVFYCGFAPHAQSSGSAGMISFYLKDANLAPKVLERLKLILFAESLGGVESLLTYPIIQTHGSIPEAMRLSAGVNDRLLRLSVGLENVSDLIADLDQALNG